MTYALPVELRATAQHIAREELLLADLVPARFFTHTVPAALYACREAVEKRLTALVASFDESYDDVVIGYVADFKETLIAERRTKMQNIKRARILAASAQTGDFNFV